MGIELDRVRSSLETKWVPIVFTPTYVHMYVHACTYACQYVNTCLYVVRNTIMNNVLNNAWGFATGLAKDRSACPPCSQRPISAAKGHSTPSSKRVLASLHPSVAEVALSDGVVLS